MTRLEELAKYVRDLADEMGLRDWRFGVGDGGVEDSDAYAECDVTYGQKWADICFREDWIRHEPEFLRWIVVHELVHCHVEPMRQVMCHLHSPLDRDMYTVIQQVHNNAMEHAVDGIARNWAETLPLPVFHF